LNDAQSALKPKLKILARERRQIEDSQYNKKHKGYLYGPRIVEKIENEFFYVVLNMLLNFKYVLLETMF